jgi:hypothetical protein
MWYCSKCGEEVDDEFDVCWSCGTTREGIQDTGFNPETEGVLTEQAYQAVRDARQDETFVTVARFGNAPEAHMVRSRLEAEGIPAYVMNEMATNTWGFAMDVVRLQVAEKDSERARAILASLPHLLSPPAIAEDEFLTEEESAEEDEEEDVEETEGEDRIQE